MIGKSSNGFLRVAAFLAFALLFVVVKPVLAKSASLVPDLTNICVGPQPSASAPSAGGVSGAPLAVNAASHIVVMEYEAWFGPAAGTYPQASVTTCLQTKNMQAMGGGYDSSTPAVISQHIAWLEQMGVDAVTLDLSNDVACIFDGDNAAIIHQVCPQPVFRHQLLAIQANDGIIYKDWSQHTRLKIIPLLGGFGARALTPDQDDASHRSALEKEVDYFGALMAASPNLSVLYLGKPLMLIYLSTPVDPARVKTILSILRTSGLDRNFSFRLAGGYLDSQPAFWENPNIPPAAPIQIAPSYGFWSVVDRLNNWGAPPAPYYPTYNAVGSGVENMTASIATEGQEGWLCPTKTSDPYCPDAALRYCGQGFQNGCEDGNYETFAEFMAYARELQPIFLIINQFNEFALPDEGPDANTNDDIEPTVQWGYSGLSAVTAAIKQYRQCCGL